MLDLAVYRLSASPLDRLGALAYRLGIRGAGAAIAGLLSGVLATVFIGAGCFLSRLALLVLNRLAQGISGPILSTAAVRQALRSLPKRPLGPL